MFGVSVPNFERVGVNIAGGMDYKKITLRKSVLNINGSDFAVSGSYDWSNKTHVVNGYVYSGLFDLNKIIFFS